MYLIIVGVFHCLQLVAEFVGTFFLMFAGEAAEVVDKGYGNKIMFPGVAVVWGLTVLVLVYAVSHISGAHFNPAITLAFASTGRFPYKNVSHLISTSFFSSPNVSNEIVRHIIQIIIDMCIFIN